MLKSTLLLAGVLGMTLPAAAAVDGVYTSDCQVVQSSSATISFDFAASELSLSQIQRTFLDQACKNAGYDLVITGPYALDASGALDYTFDTITVTPLSALVAGAFNAQKLCGLTGWTLGKPQSIAGLTCSGQEMPASGTVVYDLVKEVEGGIQTGKVTDDLDGSTAEKRPTEVDSGFTYHSAP